MTLPKFKYHPDPIATGSISSSDEICLVCEQARGYIYNGSVYAVEELNDAICPFCIADGTAHEKFDAEFTDAAGVGGYGEWETVADEIVAEVAYRTPGFSGWQQERWFTHCGDAGEFLGAAGKVELERLGSGAMEAVRKEAGLNGEDWQAYLQALDKESSPTAYIFKCRHCGAFGGYSDCD
jgi:uncharacterized protein CbrC (UPF0167 family)